MTSASSGSTGSPSKILDGKDARAAMPLVQDHLDRCDECREEFEALLEVLREVA